jgi:hypothetical protein
MPVIIAFGIDLPHLIKCILIDYDLVVLIYRLVEETSSSKENANTYQPIFELIIT